MPTNISELTPMNVGDGPFYRWRRKDGKFVELWWPNSEYPHFNIFLDPREQYSYAADPETVQEIARKINLLTAQCIVNDLMKDEPEPWTVSAVER